MEPPYPPGQHPVDVIESLAAVLYVIAKQDPGPLIDVLKQGTAAPDPQLCFVVSALGVAPVGQVLAPLSQALKHPDKQVRWSAARALVKLRTKKAIGPLVEGIGDRSTAVKFVVVEAMHSSKFFRTSKAIGPLERIIESRSIERRAPGLWRYANEVLAMLDSQD
jgi:HEAT repeat protein